MNRRESREKEAVRQETREKGEVSEVRSPEHPLL